MVFVLLPLLLLLLAPATPEPALKVAQQRRFYTYISAQERTQERLVVSFAPPCTPGETPPTTVSGSTTTPPPLCQVLTEQATSETLFLVGCAAGLVLFLLAMLVGAMVWGRS